MIVCVSLPRLLGVLLAACLAGGIAAADSAELSGAFETDTYRAGPVLMQSAASSPAACAVDCSATDRCHAWSFTGGICELKPAMGTMSMARGAESGLFFPGVGHLALRDVDVPEVRTASPQVLAMLRRSGDSDAADVVDTIVTDMSQPVTTARAPQTSNGTFVPRQVTSWTLPGTSVAPSTSSPETDSGFEDFDDGLPPGVIEEDGVIYIESDEVEEDFFAF